MEVPEIDTLTYVKYKTWIKYIFILHFINRLQRPEKEK